MGNALVPGSKYSTLMLFTIFSRLGVTWCRLHTPDAPQLPVIYVAKTKWPFTELNDTISRAGNTEWIRFPCSIYFIF